MIDEEELTGSPYSASFLRVHDEGQVHPRLYGEQEGNAIWKTQGGHTQRGAELKVSSLYGGMFSNGGQEILTYGY